MPPAPVQSAPGTIVAAPARRTGSPKRAAALLTLIVLSPLLAVIAVALQLVSPGPTLVSVPAEGPEGRLIYRTAFRTTRRFDRDDPGPGGETALGWLLARTGLVHLPRVLDHIR